MDDARQHAAGLERRLLAAQKTVAALSRRVEAQVGEGTSSFAVLEQNVALERIVRGKTQELERQRSQLERALGDLRDAQVELLQAQKLESVGRLASGVAHEINTPVQFVSDSVFFVRDAFQDLAPVFAALQRLVAAEAEGRELGPVVKALVEATAAADVGYLVENASPALERAMEGLDRVTTIVRSLKEFAHPVSRQAEPADLNRALQTTLTIARNEFKYVADVALDLGDIPPVSCMVGELQQVFLNLIVNAAHAIEDVRKGSGERGLIRIATTREGNRVVISVADDGGGIPEAIRHRVFDPFFTTKAVGRGTGQGLSIARSVVVDKHGGAIDFESEPGRGTVFRVRLPLAGPAAATTP